MLIVTYNSVDFVGRLCGSILSQDYDLSRVLVVVVDNGSVDGTVEEFLRCLERGDVNYVVARLGRNLGFTPANNVGLALASRVLGGLGDRVVLLLNPDTYLLDKGFFRVVDRVSSVLLVVGFATVSGEGGEIVDSIGGFIDFLGNPQDLFCCVRFTPGLRSLVLDVLPRLCLVPLVCFAAVAIRGDVISRLGFLRNDYVMYFDDTEYCLRLWSSSVPVAVYRGFMVWHARGGTQRGRGDSRRRSDQVFMDIPYHFAKNNLLLIYEYLGPIRYSLRLLLYGVIGALWRRRYLAFAITDSVKLIVRGRVRRRRLPRGLVPFSPRTWTLLWALKYFIRYPARGLSEAISYGTKRASLEYIRLRVLKRLR